MNESPDVLEQVPAGGGMNKPASGTYGEKAELARLQAELPAPDQAAPVTEQPQLTPGIPAGAPAPTSAGGVPGVIMRPTTRPDVPVSTPLARPPQNPLEGAVDARQRRLRYLDILSTHPDATPEVREWAEITKQKLIARG